MESTKKQNETYTNRQDNFLCDALECIERDEECMHTPDKLDSLGMVETSAGIVQYFKCRCGKEVKEFFTSSGRNVY